MLYYYSTCDFDLYSVLDNALKTVQRSHFYLIPPYLQVMGL